MTFYVPAHSLLEWTDMLIIYMKTDAEETNRDTRLTREASLTADFVMGSVTHCSRHNNYRRKTKIKQKKSKYKPITKRWIL